MDDATNTLIDKLRDMLAAEHSFIERYREEDATTILEAIAAIDLAQRYAEELALLREVSVMIAIARKPRASINHLAALGAANSGKL